MPHNPELVTLARTCLSRARESALTDPPTADQSYLELLRSVRDASPAFAFERDGRPEAIAAVREALPLVEQDLFDAVIEDHACEVEALEEVVRQLLLACSTER